MQVNPRRKLDSKDTENRDENQREKEKGSHHLILLKLKKLGKADKERARKANAIRKHAKTMQMRDTRSMRPREG